MRDAGDGEDEDLAGDLVGTVSARLLATGLPRDQRIGALRLLGALDTLADRDDRVRRPLRQVGTEFDLPDGEVDAWLDALERVGAVAVDDEGIRLLGREDPPGTIRLHDFLAVVAELGDPPARGRHEAATLRPVAAVLAAAALIAAVLLTPGVVRDRTSDQPADVAARAAGTVTTGRTASAPGTAAAPALGRGATTALPPAVARRTTPCPTRIPSIDVLQVVSGTTTTVSGVITNAAAEPVEVTAFTVIATVGGHDLPGVAGTIDPVQVPAGGSAPWTATLPTATPEGTSMRATLDQWQWQGTAAACPAR